MSDPRGVVLLDDKADKLVTLPVNTEAKVKVDGAERVVRLRMARGVLK